MIAVGGGAVCRDDVGLGEGMRKNLYSRLEITVRPYSSLHVLEIAAKGTIRNREVFHRNQFQKLDQVDPSVLRESVDLWILEYAERYADDG